MVNAILASTSTVHGSGPLDYLIPELEVLFENCKEILFIPYARPGGISLDDYTENVEKSLSRINKRVRGIHQVHDAVAAIGNAEAIFTGGGNTFVLLNSLYMLNLLNPLRKALQKGTSYLGTSAGSNIFGQTIGTTNDMPIVYPPSFEALGLVEFNINPHYIDPDPGSTHMGETRETRIMEFHVYNSIPVIGLREGSFLVVRDKEITLEGPHKARLFRSGQEPVEVRPGSLIS